MSLSRDAYDALCIHGPGSPDWCGHPHCVGARSLAPATEAEIQRNAARLVAEAEQLLMAAGD